MPISRMPPSLERAALGKALSVAREAAGLNQSTVAKTFGKSDKAVSAWEKGRGLPDALTLKSLARLYKTTPNRLLGISNESALLPDDILLAIDRLDQKEKAKLENVLRAHLDLDGLGGEDARPSGARS